MPATRAAGSLGLGASPQNFGLDVVARLPAHVFEQALENFHVARFVPHLARHVELEFPRRIGEIEQRAARGFHRLQLAGQDAVQARAQRFLVERHRSAELRVPAPREFRAPGASASRPNSRAARAVRPE